MLGPLKVVLKPNWPGRKEPVLWELQWPILRATDQGFVPTTAPTLAAFLKTLSTSLILSCLEER